MSYNLAAAVMVAKKESWRRQAVWSKVQEFSALTKFPATSPIISLVVGVFELKSMSMKELTLPGGEATGVT